MQLPTTADAVVPHDARHPTRGGRTASTATLRRSTKRRLNKVDRLDAVLLDPPPHPVAESLAAASANAVN
jgi:hypothetical protein